ncbi:glutathione peroxidase [Citricoccus nitrophenolicus]|uniref:Glutathione peroxidase n=1 Tax=Citricoccus muralis TaxID=169134 RepID=A0A3D9LEC6_9MICC|nr:glutathione peroxidase [Citricoccus muralis]REE04210.1 glutathione peroxidase [Citricoccus muralis]
MPTLSDFTARTATGEDRPLSDYAGHVVLVVNTASQCGLTPQFEGLQELYRDYRDRGLVVLGFPCNQFAHQEPGTDAEASEFCQLNYGVDFPMFAKVEVNGSGAHPLFAWLRQETSGLLGGAVKWNFTKFLLGRDGTVLERFAPTTAPAKMRGAIETALTAQ